VANAARGIFLPHVQLLCVPSKPLYSALQLHRVAQQRHHDVAMVQDSFVLRVYGRLGHQHGVAHVGYNGGLFHLNLALFQHQHNVEINRQQLKLQLQPLQPLLRKLQL
jgi:hypothetical protein